MKDFSFDLKNLALVAGNYHFMNILEEGGPVIASSKDLIGYGFPIEMTSTLSFMEFTLDPLCINFRQTFKK